MPTDIPALIERLRAHCYCGSSKWLTEDRPESDLCDVCLAATALAEQGKALAAARVAEGEAMLVVEQQDREIARLERLCDLQQGQLTAEQDARDTACRQLAELTGDGTVAKRLSLILDYAEKHGVIELFS